MDILFLHPNFPGQFRRLAAALARRSDTKVHAVADAGWIGEQRLPGIETITYASPEKAGKGTHPYVRNHEAAVRRGQQVVRLLLQKKREGYEPDVIYVHPGWGDGLFIKDIFPTARVIALFEYFYHARGADVGFDPEFPMSFDDIFRVRLLNSIQHLALEACDIGICPTEWQRSRYPDAYRSRLLPLHEGIDTERVSPDPQATYALPDGNLLSAGDEVLTFVSRNLEPYRGFHQFMRALPRILKQRPAAQVIVVGDDKVSYGRSAPKGQSWKEIYRAEVAGQLGEEGIRRVHFTGPLPWSDYLRVLQVSRAHVYLTYPFILSWSLLEALAAGCLVIASDTAPVREVIADGDNGLLVPFFSPEAIAARAIEALADPVRLAPLRERARRGIVARYDFSSSILPRQLELLGLAGDPPPSTAQIQ